MKKHSLDTRTLDGLENIISFLKKYDIESEYVTFNRYGYSRTIQFSINEQTYQIVWFIGESKLKIGVDKRSPFVVFKYIYFDDSFPIVGGNRSLGFSYTRKEVESTFDVEFNYQDFRIPLTLTAKTVIKNLKFLLQTP